MVSFLEKKAENPIGDSAVTNELSKSYFLMNFLEMTCWFEWIFKK
jgi:hypothetical protein